ncbi:MAG: PIN domain-containing protein [Kiritimatiellae bacterium]|nr:PIN domain-containing protein [Kiritimatiellia bacterium]
MIRAVLVDSSWYIQLSRSREDPLKKLAMASEHREIATCGVVVAEVGRGIRLSKFLKEYAEAWNEMRWIDSSKKIWYETMKTAWELDRRGIVLPIQDIHVAVCAMQIGAVVLTFDDHFQQIPGVTATDTLY